MKIIETIIKRFDGGVVNDPRDPRENTALMTANFDTTDSRRLIPFKDSETGDDTASSNKISNFCIAQKDASTYALYGLGISGTGTNRAKVFYKDISTGAANDLDDDDWTATANPESAANSSGLSTEMFVYYKKQGLIYMVDIANDKIMAYDPDGGTAWDESQALTMTHATQGIVHSKDDILYFGYYNSAGSAGAKSYIAKKSGSGAWSLTALALPDHLMPEVICEYGNYIAIGCRVFNPTASDIGGSVVYLWDRDATLTTLSESVYWGDDRLMMLEEINGNLIGISYSYTGRVKPRVIFRYLSVSNAVEFATLTPTASSGSPDFASHRKQKINNKLYFLLEADLNDEDGDGLWSVSGRPGDWKIVRERTFNNDTAMDNVNDALVGFFIIGDYVFVSYTDNSVYGMSKTNDTASYTATSVYSKLFNTVDSATYKDLIGITVITEPLPAAGQVVLKYKADEDSSWSSAMLTHSTDNAISASAVTSLPKNYKELKIRIESTGGAVVTGLKFKEEVIDKDIY